MNIIDFKPSTGDPLLDMIIHKRVRGETLDFHEQVYYDEATFAPLERMAETLSGLNRSFSNNEAVGEGTKTLMQTGEKCRHCNGKGYKWGFRHWWNLFEEKIKCDTCWGTGKKLEWIDA